MIKQTVEQRYQEQKMMKGKPQPSQLAEQAIQPPQKQNAQKIFNHTTQALQEAQQAVQQAKLANPMQIQLMMADEKLIYAQQQIEQLKSTELGISKGTEQQLTQLQLQIETAAGTLQMIQQTMG